MKNNKNVLQQKIDRLINVTMNDGVQPSDLADNIFEEAYSKISFSKDKNNYYAELTFDEFIEQKLISTTLRYTYEDKRLMRIEEINISRSLIQWDRKTVEESLVKEIVNIIEKQNIDSSKFIKSLPDHLKFYFQMKFAA